MQIILCIEWIDSDLCICRELVHLPPITGTTTDQICLFVKDVLLRLKLSL